MAEPETLNPSSSSAALVVLAPPWALPCLSSARAGVATATTPRGTKSEARRDGRKSSGHRTRMNDDAVKLVELLGLAPHPEGGFFKETWRAPLTITGIPHGSPRAASTAIYFLLPAGAF